VEAFGKGYQAHADDCGCFLPGGGGLSDGDIAGKPANLTSPIY
jgi:hypothetical protein